MKNASHPWAGALPVCSVVFTFSLSCFSVAAAATRGEAHAHPVPGFTFIRALGGIDEYRLDTNGLHVLVRPDHAAPVVTFNVTYRVGSRNEVTGTTGATHILEHLMFKGSEHFNDPAANGVKQYLERVGGGYNATTWLDRTNYYATLGKGSLEGYVAIEADRMRNLWLREADRRSEMTVVRNEYERGENDPGNALEEEVVAAAFRAHPYHHSTIGWKSDIEQVPIEKLKEFYDTFYWPDNATVVIVGDVETPVALALVRKHYGAIPKAPRPIPGVYTTEPPQSGARRVILKRAGQLGSVVIGYKGPHGLATDLAALDVLSAILSSGKNSRFSRALLEASLATSASADIMPTRDPGLFMVRAQLVPDVKHEAVESALLAEIGRIKKDGVTAEEVARAVGQFRARESYGRDGCARVASALNEWIAVGDWTQFVTHIDRLANVTREDVQRVANTYLNEDQSTTGWFVPVIP